MQGLKITKIEGKRKTSYEARFRAGADAFGLPIPFKERFDTEAEARAWAEETGRAADRGVWKKASEKPLAIALAERWTRRRTRGRIIDATYRDQSQAIARFFGPLLDRPIGKITTEMIDACLLREAERVMTTTLGRAFDILHSAFREFVRMGELERDPMAPLERPRGEGKPKQTWTVREVERFLAVAATTVQYPLWGLMLEGGMRLGEVQALQWRNVDLDENVVHVRHTLTRVFVGTTLRYAVKDGTKTRGGRRSIYLSPALRGALSRHKAQAKQTARAFGWTWSEERFVFPRADGQRWISSTVIASRLTEACAAAGVPRLTPHELRHTGATRLAAQGMPLRLLADRLGHRSTKMTDRYLHGSVADQAAWAGRLNGWHTGTEPRRRPGPPRIVARKVARKVAKNGLGRDQNRHA